MNTSERRATHGATVRNPLDRERRLDALALGLSAVALAAAAAWALWPVHEPEPKADLAPRPGSLAAASEAADPLDAGPFERATLWPIIDEPEPEPPPEPAGPPAELTLIGISNGPGGRRAAFFDKASDRVVQLAAGETVGDVRISSVSDTEVSFERRGRTGTWSLEHGPRSLRGGENGDGKDGGGG